MCAHAARFYFSLFGSGQLLPLLKEPYISRLLYVYVCVYIYISIYDHHIDEDNDNDNNMFIIYIYIYMYNYMLNILWCYNKSLSKGLAYISVQIAP